MRVAALQGAAGEFSAERADERAAARAASADRAIGNAYEAVDRETGEVIATEFLATQAQMDAFRAANPGATIRAAVPKDSITDSDFFTKFGFTKEEFYALPIDEQRRLRGLETTPSGEFIKIRMPDGQEVTVRSDSAEADRLTGEGGQRVSITAAKILDPLLNVDLLNRIEFGTYTPEEYAIFENAVVNPYVLNAEGQMVMGQLAPSILEMQARMAIRGKPTVLPPNGAQLAPYVERLKTLMDAQGLRSVDEIGFNLGAPPRTFQEIVSPVMLKRLEQDARSAFGPNAALREFANLGVGAIPVVDFDAIAPITQKVVADVNSVNLAMEMVVRNMSVGKLDAAGVERFVATLPAPASFTISPDAAAARAEATVGFLQNQVNAAKAGLDTQTGEDRQKLETAIFQGEQAIKFYMALIEGIKGAPMSAAEIQKAIDAAKVEELRNMLPNGN